MICNVIANVHQPQTTKFHAHNIPFVFEYVRQVASRIAEERGGLLGHEVGYLIRFDDCTDPSSTRIKVAVTLKTMAPFNIILIKQKL